MANTIVKSSDTSLRGMSYEIRNILSGGLASDDSNYPLRLIDRVIRDEYMKASKDYDDLKESKGERLDTQREVTYSCLDMVENDDFKCKCTGKGGAFKKVTLPKFIQIKGTPFIRYFGNTDMDFDFTPQPSIFEMNAYYGMINRPSYFAVGNTAYVALPPDFALMCQVSVIGIPSDPFQTSGPCFDIWSKEWNVTDYLRQIVKQRVLEFLGNPLSISSQTRDRKNNASPGNEFVTIQQP